MDDTDKKMWRTFVFRRRIQVALVVAAIGAVACFVATDEERVASAGPQSVLETLAIGAVVVLALVFTLFNWRCPACGGFLGRPMRSQVCPNCGTDLAALGD